jgi:hypothetical protein
LALAVTSLTFEGSASARSFNAKYITCDDPSSPDYEILAIAPKRCFLGLGESMYQVQPVAGHSYPPAILLRHLHWRHWGHRRAVGRGIGCLAFAGSCAQARIKVWKPMRIAPAGDLSIYQGIKVHINRTAERPAITAWYQPGTDY